jgi:hypothetical protein
LTACVLISLGLVSIRVAEMFAPLMGSVMFALLIGQLPPYD